MAITKELSQVQDSNTHRCAIMRLLTGAWSKDMNFKHAKGARRIGYVLGAPIS